MTRIVELAVVSMHMLAAIVWIGGMAFLGVVAVPVMRKREQGSEVTEFFRRCAVRFRTVGWACIAVLLVSGIANLRHWGIRWSQLLAGDFWMTSFGRTLAAKLTVIAIILALSAAHDFFIGPRASAAIREAPGSTAARRLRLAASWIGRVNFLCAIAVIVLAVMLVRGS